MPSSFHQFLSNLRGYQPVRSVSVEIVENDLEITKHEKNIEIKKCKELGESIHDPIIIEEHFETIQPKKRKRVECKMLTSSKSSVEDTIVQVLDDDEFPTQEISSKSNKIWASALKSEDIYTPNQDDSLSVSKPKSPDVDDVIAQTDFFQAFIQNVHRNSRTDRSSATFEAHITPTLSQFFSESKDSPTILETRLDFQKVNPEVVDMQRGFDDHRSGLVIPGPAGRFIPKDSDEISSIHSSTGLSEGAESELSIRAWATVIQKLGNRLLPSKEDVGNSWAIGDILKQVSSERIPLVIAKIHSLEFRNSDILITLKDPTGEIRAIVHKEVYADYGDKVCVESTVIIKNVAKYTVYPSFFYLIITLDNIMQLYPPLSEEIIAKFNMDADIEDEKIQHTNTPSILFHNDKSEGICRSSPILPIESNYEARNHPSQLSKIDTGLGEFGIPSYKSISPTGSLSLKTSKQYSSPDDVSSKSSLDDCLISTMRKSSKSSIHSSMEELPSIYTKKRDSSI
ncbi:hypothetical protein K7432_004837 [Basidiobolus ranarum]|uniref:Homologous recombination OB-fold protein OB-fold domain-containing protein n=1 Tax=Basidiobolus ranarum TaxID=34480 RepID=A0ABR2W4J5_9FUNG